MVICFFFFFSSRRRHTRYWRDWSSDVCSSDLFHSTVDHLTPQLVTVSGVAGVGKSRLSWEFEKYVDGLAEGVWWHHGRCLSYGEGVTYWALADMMRMRVGSVEGEPSEAVA